jgi:DNA ligase (NAD+)
MSQDKVLTPADFIKWANKRNYDEFIIQYKLDGISIELQYSDGNFKCAVTRGDGKVGDDVSANVVKMNGFKPYLKSRFTGAIRGEVLMFHDVYEKKYNDKQNCRNAAAGIVRRKDGEGNEDLNIIFYDSISTTNDVKFNTELDKVLWLKAEDLPTVETKILKSVNEVVKFRQKIISTIRKNLNFDIDGLVIKGQKIDLEDLKRAKPTTQIAFKFEAETTETILKAVDWSLSGPIYTPVAIVETVQLMGTNVTRASLVNPNLIKEMQLKIGSTVLISKRGDIIPKIESVLESPPDAQGIKIPSECETCHAKLVNEGTRLYCPNEDCPKRYYRRLLKWIKTLDIKLFGEKLMLKDLFESGKVRFIADLYRLTEDDIKKYGATAVKALDNLYAIKEVSLVKFIAGFDIEGIGTTLVQKLVAAGFDTYEKMINATEDKIVGVEGFADITADILIKGLKKRKIEMETLLNSKKIKIIEAVKERIFEGLSFCFTGKLDTLSRKDAEQLVISLGGQIKSSVTKNLSYLVSNSSESTAKLKKAKNQGIKIITEAEFLQLTKNSEVPRIKSLQQSKISNFKSKTPNNAFHAKAKPPKPTIQTLLINIPKKSKKFKQLSFCFTGKLKTMTRSEAEKFVISHGGIVKNNIVNSLNYLVTNYDIKTKKYMQAKSKGVKIISEIEFLDMVKTKQANITDFKKTLKKDIKNDFEIFYVEKSTPIREFVELKGLRYNSGNAYYELVKTEQIHPNKKIIVVNKDTKEAYYDQDARELLDLSTTEKVHVSPSQTTRDNYIIFIQSKSVNRKLSKDTNLLYIES